MGDTNGSKHKHMFKKLKRHRKATGDKYKKAIDSYILLLKREEKGGSTKLILNAKDRAFAKLKKFGIATCKIEEALENKGLGNLSSKLSK